MCFLSLEVVHARKFRGLGGDFLDMTLEERVPAWHPLRSVRELVRDVLSMTDKDFRTLYAKEGRPSIPPK